MDKDIHYHCPLISLPSRINYDIYDLSFKGSYLQPTGKFKSPKCLKESRKLKIGVVWKVSATAILNQHRNMDFEQFLSMINAFPQFDFYSLQKGCARADILNSKASNFYDLSPWINDFNDTAHLIEQMDVVITVDTAVAHLAGALNKTCLVMIPTNHDWRWFVGSDKTMWYDAMKLYRQKEPGNWSDIIKQVINYLHELNNSNTG